MADYQRFVSYIYSYPGGVKDKNVGFAKVEVVRGEIRLNINLRGVYTDTPELFGVYLLFAGYNSGEYQLLKAGDCMVQNVWLCTRAYLIRPTLIVQGIHFLTYAALE